MSIFSKETIKKLAQEAALQFTTAEECNPFVNNTDAAELFKKYFETEITYAQLETAIEQPHTDAVSTTVALDIKTSLGEIVPTPSPFAPIMVTGVTA